jgi:hypothetical protein
MIVHLVLQKPTTLSEKDSLSLHLSNQVYVFGHFGKPKGHHFSRAIVHATCIPEGTHRVAKVIQKIRGYVDRLVASLDDFSGACGMVSEKRRQVEDVGIHNNPISLASNLWIVVIANILEAEQAH